MKYFVHYKFEIFQMIKVLKKIGCGLQNAHSKLYDVIIALAAEHDTLVPAITGIAKKLTTSHIKMMFLQLDRAQLLVCQHSFLSLPEVVA